MAEYGWTSLGVVPELDKGFDAKLSRGLDSSLGKIGKTSGQKFGHLMGKAAVAGFVGVAAAGFAAFRLGKDALGEAREAQEIGRTSAAILKATGQAANLNRKEYDKLTAALMRKTAIDDEQIAQGGNLLLTFKNVKREGKGLKDIFGRGLSAALDLSAAGFGSIESGSKMLGKALNDPVKGITALSRAGVTFTATQVAAIGKMVEQNRLLGAQKIILKEVESQVGGTAAAQKTSAKELEVAWGNVKEELGFALIPVMDDLADVMLERGIPAAREFAGWVGDEAVPAVKDFVTEVKPLVEKALPAIGDGLHAAYDIGKKLVPVAEGIVSAFADMPEWAQKALVGGGAAALLGAKLKPNKGGLATGILGGLKPVPVFVTNMGAGGLGTGGLGGGKTKTGKGPLALGLSPLLLPLLLGGDSPDTKPDGKAEEAYRKLLIETKAKSSQELFDALAGATKVQLRSYRKMLKDEFGFGFKALEGADFSGFRFPSEGNGWERGGPLPTGLTAGDQKRRDRALESTFEIKPTKGQSRAEKDFLRLIGYRNDLTSKRIEPAVQILGVNPAIEAMERLTTATQNYMNLAAMGAGPDRDPRSPATNYYGPVTYTDAQQQRRDAANRRRRAADGVQRR